MAKLTVVSSQSQDLEVSNSYSEIILESVTGCSGLDTVLLAKLADMRHDNLLQLIDSPTVKSKIDLLTSQETSYTDRWNRKQRKFILSLEQAIVVVNSFRSSRDAVEFLQRRIVSIVVKAMQEENAILLKRAEAAEKHLPKRYEKRETTLPSFNINRHRNAEGYYAFLLKKGYTNREIAEYLPAKIDKAEQSRDGTDFNISVYRHTETLTH